MKQVEAKGFGQRSGQQAALFEVPEWTRAWLVQTHAESLSGPGIEERRLASP